MTKLACAALRVSATLAVLLSIPQSASALTSAEIGCRDAIAKSMASYAKTTGKIVAACHKSRSAGTRPLTDDCNDVDVADSAGRLPSSRSRIVSSITSACAGVSSLLGEYGSCPAPAAFVDDGGATTGIDDYEEVAECEIALSDAETSAMSAAAIGNPDETLSDNAAKCQGTLAKLSGGMIKAYMREGRKCQRSADAASSSPDFNCEDLGSSPKIAKARSKWSAKFSACTLPEERLATLNACADRFDQLRECSRAAAEAAGEQLIHNAYELEPTGSTTTTTDEPTTTTTDEPPTTTTTTLPDDSCGESAPTCNGTCPEGQHCDTLGDGCSCVVTGTGACAPATIRRIINAKYGTPSGQTSLSTGWSGNAHDVDIPNDTGDVVDVVCDANCENCNVSLNVQADNPASNCRCNSDPRQTCGVINGPDTANCGSLDPACRCYFGAPLAISSGGTPVCVVNRITQDYDGTMNLRTGEWNVRIHLASIVHLGIDSVSPCPTCQGDVTFNDGVRDGTCTGDLASGPCDTNGEHITFGPTSFDCLPSAVVNISGGGLLIDLKTSTSPPPLAATLPCDTPMGAMCACRVCSGNSSVGCSSDADCAEFSAGTCTAGGGAGVQPNQCDGFNCDPDGRCSTGPQDKYCDGITHPDGRGFLGCTLDADCATEGYGACTVIDIRRCYTDPITAAGDADITNPVTGAIFCIPPTTSPPVNLTGGLPGPGVFELDFDADIRCRSNPELPYEFPNGANCETGTTTTSTTLLPPLECENATAPACGGTCPEPGQTCQDNAGTCECADPPLPQCVDAVSPVCGGICPEGQVCVDNAGACGCTALPLPTCSEAVSPVCGGTCPLGMVCLDAAGTCSCTGI